MLTNSVEQPSAPVAVATDDVARVLAKLEEPCYVVSTERGIGLLDREPDPTSRLVAAVGPLSPQSLGASDFRKAHGVRYAYFAGAMATGISSVELVTRLARSGCLASFGAGGLPQHRIEHDIRRLANELPNGPFAVNLLHSPNKPRMEDDVVNLCLAHRVRCVEASAFIDLTAPLVRYRAAGLRRGPQGQVVVQNRVVAKVSRPEVAERFLQPAPEELLAELFEAGCLTAEQVELAGEVPMADDITVEADSGGHTDRRPLGVLFPVMVRLRDRVCRRYPPRLRVRLGAAGGIGTPQAVSAAYAMGADYVLTGSVNQSCVESGTSERVRRMLAGVGIADTDMAPSADMFELGAQVQVLKRGTMFPARAKRLYQIYSTCDGIDSLRSEERAWLEGQLFRRSLESVWADVVDYFEQRDLDVLQRAARDPKRRMALIFRWYLGNSTRWATSGDADRCTDYQIWCGPALGSFNDWVKGTYLANPENRSVCEVARHLLRGAALAGRVQQLAHAGVRLTLACTEYRPSPSVSAG